MRRGIRKNIRYGLITLLVLLLMGAAGGAVWWFLRPIESEQEIPVFKYEQQAQVDYNVAFIPNPLFPEPTAGPDRAYITPLTQSVQSTLTYRFTGEKAAELSGNYNVVATLTGYMLKEKDDEKVKVKVWERTTVLVPTTPFAGQEKELEIKKTIPVNIRQYVAFTDHVECVVLMSRV